MNLNGWANGAWADGSWVEAAWGTPEPEPVRRAGVRRRRYVDLKDRLVEVDSYEEAEKLLEALKMEEKAAQQDRKELKVLVKRVERTDPIVKGSLYEKLEARVERVESRLDNRLARIQELTQLIAIGLMNDEDDEEMLLLSI